MALVLISLRPHVDGFNEAALDGAEMTTDPRFADGQRKLQ